MGKREGRGRVGVCYSKGKGRMLINGSYFPKSMLIYGLGLVGWLTPRTPRNSACIKVIFTNQGELSREQGGKAERGEGGRVTTFPPYY